MFLAAPCIKVERVLAFLFPHCSVITFYKNEGESPEVKFKGLLGAQFGIQAGRIVWTIILKHSRSHSIIMLRYRQVVSHLNQDHHHHCHHHHHHNDQHYQLRTQVVCWLGSPEWSPTPPPPQFSSRETSSPMSTTGRCTYNVFT